MFTTRNIRAIVLALIVFSVVLFFFASPTNLNNTIQKAKQFKSADDAIALTTPQQQDEPVVKPKTGNNPPYSTTPQKVDNEVPDSKAPPKKETPKEPIIADKGHAASNNDGTAEENAKNGAKDTSLSSTPQDTQKDTKKPSSDTTAAGAACDQNDYVVMVDAGSTGSRVHVYKFDTCQAPPVLLSEEFDMLKPGLSSFDTDVKGAAASLDPLLELALKTVPKDKQGCTPVAVKATAGLRLLGKAKSDNILKEVRAHLENDYPFPVVAGDGISIMDGKDEGVYAWITTNYLLGNIGSSEKTPTAAVFDLGGGSTQIVFEPDFPGDEKMVDGEHKYEISFGNRDFTLYQFSHLGYGLMEGRNKVNSLVLQAKLKAEPELAKHKITEDSKAKGAASGFKLTNPCVPPGVTAEKVKVKLADDEIYVVDFVGPDVAAGAQCRFLAESVLNKDAECTSKPCSFNGAHQPSLTKAFKKSSDMFIFSYFYDRTNPLGFPSSFTVEELTDLAKVVCNGDQLWKSVLMDEHIKELKEEPQWCLDLSFMVAMLHTGYDIPLHRELKTAKKIDNNELGWCLGASLPLLNKTGSGWKCKVQETA